MSRQSFLVSECLCRNLTFSSFAEFCVATTFSCRDTVSIVNQFDPWSQPPFHVATSYLVFCPHASCNSNCLSVYFLVVTWKLGRDKFVSFLTVIPVATSKACHHHSFFQSCRNFIFFSHDSFYSIQLPFLVAT